MIIFLMPGGGGGAPLPSWLLRTLIVACLSIVLWPWSHAAVYWLVAVAVALWAGSVYWKWWTSPRPGLRMVVDEDGALHIGDHRSPREVHRARTRENAE